MTERLDKHILNNGLVILGEPMEAVSSVAFNFMLPAGAALLPEGCCGAASVIADWIFRGAGSKNNRELGDALDGLGLHRSSAVNSSHIIIGAALEAGNLADALELYADIVRRPGLKDNQFELARKLAIDEVIALDDNPQQKVMLKLRENFYPYPLGRSTEGNIEELNALTAQKANQIINDYFNPSQTIFTIAGKYNFDAVCRQIEKLFGTAAPKPVKSIALGPKADRYTHIHNDGAQVHIGLMTETITLSHKDYYNARVAVSVLSGGMSARLFTEVREKRGLCYAIGARYLALKEAAGIACYAGTIPQKAQQTLDLVIAEFNRLSEGITEEEIKRAKAELKSALILQSESSSSRAAGIGSDFHLLGKVRFLDEIKEKIEQTTAASILEFLRNNKFKDFTVVTIGQEQIKIGA